MNSQTAAELRDGIFLMISRWYALQAAFNDGQGGRNPEKKSEQLVERLFNLLTQSKDAVCEYDVEDVLFDFMETLGIGGDVEDGSVEEIAHKMVLMHEQCSQGNFDSVKRLKEITRSRRASYAEQCGNRWE